jgi:peptidyl-prolyl cis-trans isomerase C
VQTQFGWHVIKVLDKKATQPQPFDQIAPQLQQQLMYKTFDDTVASLKKSTKVDIPDADLAKAVKEQEATTGQSTPGQ